MACETDGWGWDICRCLVTDSGGFFFSLLLLNREPRSEERSAHTQTTQTEHNELGRPSAPSPGKPTAESEHGGVLSVNGRKVGHVSSVQTGFKYKFLLFLALNASALPPGLLYLLVLDSCQIVIDGGGHEYL